MSLLCSAKELSPRRNGAHSTRGSRSFSTNTSGFDEYQHQTEALDYPQLQEIKYDGPPDYEHRTKALGYPQSQETKCDATQHSTEALDSHPSKEISYDEENDVLPSPCTRDVCPPHGMVAVTGRRREMEDAIAAVPAFLAIPHDDQFSGFDCVHHFFGVFDGHGGSEAADFCKDRLHMALVEEVKACIENAGHTGESGSLLFSEWEKVMISSFLKVDAEISGSCPERECTEHDDEASCKKPIAAESVGSTAIVVVVNSCQIIIGNCGDSRAVLSRGGKAIALSTDHKPEREDELARVEAAGGRVIFWNGYRVLGVLAMSRALGDRYLKPFVIAEPEVTCLQRTEEDEFLILASDGLWDVLTNDAACNVVRMCLAGRGTSSVGDVLPSAYETRTAFAAAFLTKLALSRGSSDNISVLVVDLKARNG